MQTVSCELLDLVELVLDSEGLRHVRRDGAVDVVFNGDSGEKLIRFAENQSILTVIAFVPGSIIEPEQVPEFLQRVNDWNCAKRWPRAQIEQADSAQPILVGDHHLSTYGAAGLQNMRTFIRSIVSASLELLTVLQVGAAAGDLPATGTQPVGPPTKEVTQSEALVPIVPLPSNLAQLSPGYL